MKKPGAAHCSTHSISYGTLELKASNDKTSLLSNTSNAYGRDNFISRIFKKAFPSVGVPAFLKMRLISFGGHF